MKHRFALGGLVILAGVLDLVGIGWGLPSRRYDTFLFGDQEPWSGQRIAELSGSAGWRDLQRAADVDLNPQSDLGRSVTATEANVAEILRRYRLFSHQPDEMITFMAIARMHPGRFDFDPKLYQYGGLFLYPVAGLLKAGSLIGAIELRADQSYYLEHPEAFGRFYVVARLYVTLYALAGVIGVYLLASRLGFRRTSNEGWPTSLEVGNTNSTSEFANPTAKAMGHPIPRITCDGTLANRSAGLLAAAFFVLMPITISLAHEAKPHLPAAVLIVYAMLAATHYLERGTRRSLLITGLLCGLALGLVLSAWVAFLVLPIAAGLRAEPWRRRITAALLGGAVGVAVYVLTNPYAVKNALTGQAVWKENFANSRAFYPLADSVADLVAGNLRTAALVAEGMSPLLAIVGIAAVVVMVASSAGRPTLIVLGPTAALLINMALVGAGKPGEFGRFALLADIALAILVAAAAAHLWPYARTAVIPIVAVCMLGVLMDGARYEWNFVRDASATHTRARAAEWLANELASTSEPVTIGVLDDPAPYLTPPLHFAAHDAYDVIRLPRVRPQTLPDLLPSLLIDTADHAGPRNDAWWAHFYQPIQRFAPEPARFWNRPTVISWANKPITIHRLTIPELQHAGLRPPGSGSAP